MIDKTEKMIEQKYLRVSRETSVSRVTTINMILTRRTLSAR